MKKLTANSIIMLHCKGKNCRQCFIFEGGEIMKRMILAVIVGTMLLSNAAFASTKTTDTNSTATSINQNSMYDLNSTDPY